MIKLGFLSIDSILSEKQIVYSVLDNVYCKIPMSTDALRVNVVTKIVSSGFYCSKI